MAKSAMNRQMAAGVSASHVVLSREVRREQMVKCIRERSGKSMPIPRYESDPVSKKKPLYV